MKWSTAVLVLGCAFLAAGSLTAQERTPRFVLPEPPFDYTVAFQPGQSFPLRNELADRDVANARAALGRVLFYERRMSRNGSRSCASCHEQERAFADGQRRSRGFAGRRTRRNSMSIVNLATHDGPFFWDGRVETLEEQVLAPIQDPIEMGMTLEGVIERLSVEPGYAALFEGAFGTPEVTAERIAAALATFLRAITSFGSRFDEGLFATGDVDAEFPNFTPAENRGKRLFFGTRTTRRESCAACHNARAWAPCGNSFLIVSAWLQSEHCRNNGVDAGKAGDDPGLAGVTGEPADRGKFRAPSLRNVELTGPYMHDGRFATLEEVLEFYALRVRPHPTLDPVLDPRSPIRRSGGWGGSEPQPLGDAFASIVGPSPGLPMTRSEREDLLAFLKTLTDRSLLHDPRFSDPFVRR